MSYTITLCPLEQNVPAQSPRKQLNLLSILFDSIMGCHVIILHNYTSLCMQDKSSNPTIKQILAIAPEAMILSHIKVRTLATETLVNITLH